MVQKYQSPVRVYKYPFELVMSAYERRFPTCKMIPVFLGSDIISEYKSEDGAIHVVERRCRLNVDAPYILKKIAGVDCVIFVQKNALDRRNRTLLIEARNETFSSRVIVNEFCQYTVHPENSGWTCFEQSASLDIKHFFGFESTVEKIAMKQYSTNIKKGKEVIEYYINELISEGVKNIPTWLEQQEVMKLALGIPVDEADIAGSSKETIEEEDQYEDAIMTLGASAAALRRSSIQEEEKLEDEYIHRCLGELTPFQESQLVQLKKWIADTHKGKMPQDEHMLRFLRARDFNVEKAREMLCHSLAWRKKYGIDRLLITYTPATLIQQYFPGGWHSAFDHEGRPMFLLRLGATDVKGVLKCVGTDGLLHHILWILEEGLRRCEEATQRFGRPISNCTCILDLDGLSMRHLWRPGIRALLDIIQTVEANYPETMGRLLIVRAPRVFPVLWTLVSPFIDENTRRKFTILAQSDLLTSGGLVDYIGRESVPRWLGGPCTDCGIYCEGGLVPKEAFQFEFAAENPDTVYKIAVVKEPSPYELMVVVDERSSVITWDFDILKGEVLFSVYRCRNPLSRPAVEGETLLDSRTMQEGIDYVMVVQSIACKDGDSIQGSHVCSQPGCYVLQWRFFDSTHSLLDFSHKARIMYFCELIRGENFRGSMTSLQSSISSTAGSSSAPNSAR